ncbi:MAG: biotin/lipoyl-binding protein [Actinomycetota bacterium]|nr:biotin/lipoyl-binding protein [Actinomycetota bacterium]
MTFKSVLIANRAEISVRISRACRGLELRSIAVYSEADTTAMHRRAADESYLLGPAPASESYLNTERIVEAIEATGAEAVHPGYGFLSESAAFARAVEGAGAVWIGPSPEAMDAVGDKVRAKALAQRAKVPTVPGYDGEDQSEERLIEEAGHIDFPLLVKASAGGGGRGMRVVRQEHEFVEAVRSARREAEAAFGDSTVFLEKLVEGARHVEVQIMGDQHGNVIHLYERECSIQRRHQKVVEEAPSPALTENLRESICASAVSLAQEASYYNAGTVEFLLAGDEFYFLEMNARLQVEHPVTELVTGLDLVYLQLSIAAGNPLSISQNEIKTSGHAIETRLYAEDATGIPHGGKLHTFDPPQGTEIRNDIGFETGDEVPIDYDSMLAKLIVHAPTRPKAITRLSQALTDYKVAGVPTNVPMLKRIADHPAFESGDTTTDFLETYRLTETPAPPPLPFQVQLLAAAHQRCNTSSTTDPFDRGTWRMLGLTTHTYLYAGDKHQVELARIGGGRYRASSIGETHILEVVHCDQERIRALLDGELVEAEISLNPPDLQVKFSDEVFELRIPPPPTIDDAGPGANTESNLTAPMPGTVVKVLIAKGDEVREGQTLLVLEAMKMEQAVRSPHPGIVRSLPFEEGAKVIGGAVLVEIEPEQNNS